MIENTLIVECQECKFLRDTIVSAINASGNSNVQIWGSNYSDNGRSDSQRIIPTTLRVHCTYCKNTQRRLSKLALEVLELAHKLGISLNAEGGVVHPEQEVPF